MSKANDVMQNLTAQWYNALVTGLGLDPQKFQVCQGPNSLVTTSQDMWNIFAAVPPKAVNNYYDPNLPNKFYSDYSLILSALVSNSDSTFQQCMGDYYTDWQTYFKENMPDDLTVDSVSKVFKQWAILNAPGQANCVNALTKIFIDPVNSAQIKFSAADNKYAWDRTIDALMAALAGGADISFTLDSTTASSELSHTWAKASTSVIYDLFSFGASGSYDKLSTKVISSGLNISAKFHKVTTFPAGPYAQANPNNPELRNYVPWYDGAVLPLAYTTKDNTVWNNQKPTTWEKAFGTDGFLQRMTSALVVADGVTITMTSSASFSSSERTNIHTAAKGGIWPFFTAKIKGKSLNKVKFDESGKFTITTTIPAGNRQLLGILQTPMSAVFS